KEKEIIRLAVQRGQLTGGAAFIDEIEVRLNRRIEFRRQGRPKKHEALKPERETDQRSVPSKQEGK
ncbi:MAG: hypothetical protein IMF11_18745, partial [Proteobacteria bacterium]|nr:hypothetical protein [Pseudomonadota bacterium]